jgi:hypothetical protein
MASILRHTLTFNRNSDANSTSGQQSPMPSQSSASSDHNPLHMASRSVLADQRLQYGLGLSDPACLLSSRVQ